MTESEKIPGRRISEEALRSIASEISAGKTLVPESWPNQSRVAVLLSFDVHTQTTTSRFASSGASAIKCWWDDAKTLRCIKLQPK